MAHRGSSGLLEALDTSAEREDQGYSDLFGFGNIIDTSDDSDYPGDPTEDTEEDDVVLVEETPPEVTGHKVTKRPLEFKGSFTKDYKIPRKTTDSEVVEASPVLPDKVQHYSSPLSKAQYPPCNTQYTPRTQNNPRINVKLMTGKNTFNSYREDQQAHVIHMNSDSNSFNRGNHTSQNSQKLSVHLPAFQTVAMKPRIVVDGHQVSSTVHVSPNAVKHGVNRNSSSTTSVKTEDYSTDVAGSSGTSTVVTVSDTGNSSGSDTNVSPSVQIKLQHEKGHLTGGEAISTGGLQGGGRGMLNKGQAAARGGPVRRGRGRPPSALKGNAMGMNMLSSACVNLGNRCDADQTSGSSSSSNQKGGLGFQDEFLRQVKQKAAADNMRNVLSPPCRLGAWKHAEVDRKTVISSSTVTSTTQLNGEASQDTQQVSRTAEFGTEKKEADSLGDGEEEEEAEDEGNISFLCKNCGNSTYQRDRCNSCGKNTLQKVSTNHDPLKPKARAPLSRKGMPATSFYKDKMARFSNIYSPGTSTTTVSQSRITATTDTKQTQQRLYQPTTRQNTRNAGRPVGRPRVSQKVPEVVLISDDEDEPPKPAVQPEASPASQPSSRPSTPVPEPDTGHGTLRDSTSEVDSTQHKEVPETPVTPKVTPVKAFITDTGNKTAKFDIRAIRIGSRLIQPCEVVTSIEKGISLKVEDHTVELQQNDIVQSVAHFGSNTPFIQLCVTPKIGLALRSRLRFKKKEGLDWFDPGSSDASEKYILLLLHGPVPPTRADVLRLHLQSFSSQHGFVEVEDKEKANNILMELEVKEPLQKSEKTTFITTQSVLAKQDPSTSYKATSTEAQTPSPTLHRPSTEPRGSSTYARSSQGKTINEHRVSLPETSSRSNSPACRDHEEDDRDGFVGPIQKLMVYPPPPASGGITVTTEDLWCLRDGEFLNDVIIDFYLKYLMNTVLSEEDRKRTHIFSSFFYKRLMQRDHVRTRSEDNMHSTPIHRRHSRVKTWTRHVDLFSKDFVIVPINEHAHWYLAVVCFPGLDKEDPHPTFVPRLTRPPTPDLDPPTRPSTPASNPEQTTQQSMEESGSSAQQSSRHRAEVTSEQKSQVKGQDTALSSSSQSSVRSSEGQEDDDSSSSQGSITKGIQTEPLTREQIEAAFASQLVEEERIASRQSPRKCYETMEKVSLNPRRSPRKCADAASSSLDSTSQSSQQSSPSKRNSPRKKSEESLNQDSRHFIDEVKHSVIQSATSPRKKLKFPDADQEKKGDEEKMDVDQDQEGLSEEEKNRMETDQCSAERKAEAMQGEPMETEDRVGRILPETPASAIDTTRQGSHDQAMMDDSASDQSASAMSDQSLPTMSIRRRPCILLFDSLRGPRRAHVMKNLKEYLTVEWEVRKKDQPKREFNNMKGANPKVPQQTNYSDCGVFLLQYVETFFSNPIQDYSFPLSGLEHWFSRQRVKGKRWELQGLIQRLTEEQSGKGDDKT